jgi:hypothetical protein
LIIRLFKQLRAGNGYGDLLIKVQAGKLVHIRRAEDIKPPSCKDSSK